MTHTTALIPVEEYLDSVYEPECDYVDGTLEDRNVGEKDHSKLQAKLIRLLPATVAVFPEVRIRVTETRFRVPDVAVYATEPMEQVFSTPPYIVIEILSPEDRWSRMTQKLEDYRFMGCKNIWVIDPWRKKAYRFVGSDVIEEHNNLTAGEPPVSVQVADLW